MPELNKHSLSVYHFPRGILVFLLGLVFFQCSVNHNKAVKIGFIFFMSKDGFIMHFQSLLAFLFLFNSEIKVYTRVAVDWAFAAMVALRWRIRGLHVDASVATT